MVYVIQVCRQLASRIRKFHSDPARKLSAKPVWHLPLLRVPWKTPDYGQRNSPKLVEFHSKNKFEKLVHVVGFIIRIYHDARLHERQICQNYYCSGLMCVDQGNNVMDHHGRSSTREIRFTCVPGYTQRPRMVILNIYCKFGHKTVCQCLFDCSIQVAGEDRMWVNVTFLTGSDQEKLLKLGFWVVSWFF